MLPLCKALVDLKRIHIVHGDVALRNALLHIDEQSLELRVKLGDFGICQDIGDAKGGTTFKPKYSAHSAPEIDGQTLYEFKADVFSLGMVLVELLSLLVIHVSTRLVGMGLGDPEAEVRRVEAKRLAETVLTERKEFAPLRALVEGMLQREPAQRLAIEDVHQQLQELLHRGAVPSAFCVARA